MLPSPAQPHVILRGVSCHPERAREAGAAKDLGALPRAVGRRRSRRCGVVLISSLGLLADAFERKLAAAVELAHTAVLPLGGGVERCDKRWKIGCDHCPHDVVVDRRITVNQPIPHADDLMPGYRRELFASGVRDLARSLADDLDEALHGGRKDIV